MAIRDKLTKGQRAFLEAIFDDCGGGSLGETPTANSAGTSTMQIAESIDGESLQNLLAFLQTTHAAWGRDPEYFRLWSSLNLTICMWLYRRLVLDRNTTNRRVSPAQHRAVQTRLDGPLG